MIMKSMKKVNYGVFIDALMRFQYLNDMFVSKEERVSHTARGLFSQHRRSTPPN